MDETRTLLTLSLLPQVGPRTVRDLAARTALTQVVGHPDDHGDLLRAFASSAGTSRTTRATSVKRTIRRRCCTFVAL